ncbi:MAG: tetratricopeptide repeat protein [Rhodovibrionaceae bacterium]
MNRAERRKQAKSRRGGAPSLAQAQALLERGRDGEARRLLDRLLTQTPEDAAAWQLFGLLALRQGEAARAVEALRKADSLTPGDSGLRTNLAIALGQAGEGEAALETLEAVLSAAPDYAPALFNKAVLLRETGQEAAALAALDAALAARPDYRKAAGERARLLRDLGRYAAAAADYARADSADAESLLDWGRCLQESGDLEGALALYRRLLAQNPGSYVAVVKTLSMASKGMVYLHPSELRRRLLEHG